MRNSLRWCLVLALGGSAGFSAETLQPSPAVSQGTVTYVSAKTVYLDIGTDHGAAVGDSVYLTRGGSLVALGVLSAVSSLSSMVPLPSGTTPARGDRVMAYHRTRTDTHEAVKGSEGVPGDPPMASRHINGRVALQYIGGGSVATGFSFSQPALLLHLNVPALFGSGIRFTMHGRVTRDLGTPGTLSGSPSRTNARVYTLALTSDAPDRTFGYALGRISSRYVGGLGPIDGAELVFRTGRITGGILGGFQPDYRTSSLDTRQQKTALFANLAWRAAAGTAGDVTLAYGRQMHRGKLDRDFLYAQSSTRLGESLYLYHSSEVDVTGLEGTERKSRLRLTNTFLSGSYSPLQWLSLDAGYNATRTVYYLESMNIRTDTLMDNLLRQGVRGGMTIRLPSRIQLSGRVHVSPAAGDLRSSRTLIGMVRMHSIANSGISAGFQVAAITGMYTEGTNLSGHLEYTAGQRFTADLSGEHYLYTLVRTGDRQRTTTVSLSLQAFIDRRWHVLGGMDQLWEDGQPFQRIFAELGVRL